MRQYIKPEITVEELELYNIMQASVETEDITGGGEQGPGQGGNNDGAGSKDGFPWSDDFDFHMD